MLDGLILDGRNRFRACQDVGVPLRFEEYDGNDPAADVVSWNVHRRHMTKSQRSMVSAKLKNVPHGGIRAGQNTKASQDANLPLEAVTSAQRPPKCSMSRHVPWTRSRSSKPKEKKTH
jgi:hypothetical protein